MIQKKKLWMIENGFWGMMIAKEVDVCADYRSQSSVERFGLAAGSI